MFKVELFIIKKKSETKKKDQNIYIKLGARGEGFDPGCL